MGHEQKSPKIYDSYLPQISTIKMLCMSKGSIKRGGGREGGAQPPIILKAIVLRHKGVASINHVYCALLFKNNSNSNQYLVPTALA